MLLTSTFVCILIFSSSLKENEFSSSIASKVGTSFAYFEDKEKFSLWRAMTKYCKVIWNEDHRRWVNLQLSYGQRKVVFLKHLTKLPQQQLYWKVILNSLNFLSACQRFNALLKWCSSNWGAPSQVPCAPFFWCHWEARYFSTHLIAVCHRTEVASLVFFLHIPIACIFSLA